MMSAVNALTGRARRQSNVDDGADCGVGFDVVSRVVAQVVREADRDSSLGALAGLLNLRRLRPGQSWPSGRSVADQKRRPPVRCSISTAFPDLTSMFRTHPEGERDMCVQNNPEVLVSARGAEDESTQIREQPIIPCLFIANEAPFEMRHEIERLVAARFEIVDRMYEHRTPMVTGLRSRSLSKSFSCSHMARKDRGQVLTALGMKLADQIVVNKAGFRRRDADEPHRRETVIQPVA